MLRLLVSCCLSVAAATSRSFFGPGGVWFVILGKLLNQCQCCSTKSISNDQGLPQNFYYFTSYAPWHKEWLHWVNLSCLISDVVFLLCAYHTQSAFCCFLDFVFVFADKLYSQSHKFHVGFNWWFMVKLILSAEWLLSGICSFFKRTPFQRWCSEGRVHDPAPFKTLSLFLNLALSLSPPCTASPTAASLLASPQMDEWEERMGF